MQHGVDDSVMWFIAESRTDRPGSAFRARPRDPHTEVIPAVIEHYKLKFKKPGPPIDEVAIVAVEEALRVKLPQAYRKLLLANNGGVPSPAYIPYPGEGTKIRRFYSMDEIASVATQHRTENGLPDSMLPVAELDGDAFVLLQCGGTDNGALFFWVNAVRYGFRQHDPDYDNVARLYFAVDQLATKFGPAKNRQDRDGLFCQLYYASSNAVHGPKLASKYVANGYDINFVLPTFRHPVFGAIDSEAFGVACALLRLGTHATHVDPQHENALVLDRLVDAQENWERMLRVTTENKYDTGIGMAKRRLAHITEAISLVTEAG